MFCGSFSHADDDPWTLSSSSSARRSGRKEKNPYADCGRDKFATVVADLEARREKIMAQVGGKDAFLVRFSQKNSRDWVPIVIKVREPKRQKTHAGTGGYRTVHRSLGAVDKLPTDAKKVVRARVGAATAAADGKMKKRFSWSWNEKGYDLLMAVQKPSGYWPLVLTMILLCLVVFGRSFAIVCMSICWYLVPTMKSGNVIDLRRSVKKSYKRGLSGKN